jgi:hypothetical protein
MTLKVWLGCIYNHQTPSSYYYRSAIREQSATLAWTVRPCTINGWITTVSYNDYINSYNHIKCVVRCQIKFVVDGSVVPLDNSRVTLKLILLNPSRSGWSVFQRADDPHMMATIFSFSSDSS